MIFVGVWYFFIIKYLNVKFGIFIFAVIIYRCLEYLLRNDANPGIRDKQGYNAVHYSAAYGHRLCLQLVRFMNSHEN